MEQVLSKEELRLSRKSEECVVKSLGLSQEGAQSRLYHEKMHSLGKNGEESQGGIWLIQVHMCICVRPCVSKNAYIYILVQVNIVMAYIWCKQKLYSAVIQFPPDILYQKLLKSYISIELLKNTGCMFL